MVKVYSFSSSPTPTFILTVVTSPVKVIVLVVCFTSAPKLLILTFAKSYIAIALTSTLVVSFSTTIL